ncbi:hypothetical protein COLO4_28400 [Corchorus olitorius]|uniref:Uncharacterized protein n=1 Tax=Corchorus olitorius TaxID=93759 RepID=A0A1R3HL85_9ROSI|nr:hypothetical protein COLO4_28400 [Corchorus olitorius]
MKPHYHYSLTRHDLVFEALSSYVEIVKLAK